MPSCDIVIRSYAKDFPWLVYCIRSIRKFSNGFRHTLVVVPRSSRASLPRLGMELDNLVICPDYPDDYLGQQVTKVFADRLSDADYICHLDADCIFVAPTKPVSLMIDDRPRVAMIAWRAVQRNRHWQRVTERFLKRPVAYDFMTGFPLVYPRWLYAGLRDHALALHGIDLETYVLAQPRRGFSEFNALGSYAWFYHPDAFAWIDLEKAPPLDAHCLWYRSWEGLDPATERRLEKLLA